MGMTLRVEDFAAVAKRPRPVMAGVAAQYTIMVRYVGRRGERRERGGDLGGGWGGRLVQKIFNSENIRININSCFVTCFYTANISIIKCRASFTRCA